MKKVFFLIEIMLIALIAVGCDSRNGSVDYKPQAQTNEITQLETGYDYEDASTDEQMDAMLTDGGFTAPQWAVFPSLEFFLATSRILREHGSGISPQDFLSHVYAAIGPIIPYSADFDMEEAMRQLLQDVDFVDFASIERIYFPIGIPNQYQLLGIHVGETIIGFRFVPEPFMQSNELLSDALSRGYVITMTQFRSNTGLPPLSNRSFREPRRSDTHINENLLLSDTNLLMWAAETERISLSLPRRTAISPEGVVIIPSGSTGLIMFNSLDELSVLAETFIIDMSDDALVDYILAYGRIPDAWER